MNTYTLYQTDAKTFRVLINGNVNPRLVGFAEADAAIDKCQELFPGSTVDVPSELRHFIKETYTVIRSREGNFYLCNTNRDIIQATKADTPLGAINYFAPDEVKIIVPQITAELVTADEVRFFVRSKYESWPMTDHCFFLGGYLIGGMCRGTREDYTTVVEHMSKFDGPKQVIEYLEIAIARGDEIGPEDFSALWTPYTFQGAFVIPPMVRG